VQLNPPYIGYFYYLFSAVPSDSNSLLNIPYDFQADSSISINKGFHKQKIQWRCYLVLGTRKQTEFNTAADAKEK